MTPENFCYWLQGYFELSGFKDDKELQNLLNQADWLDRPNIMKKHLSKLSYEQVECVQDHLKLVFKKITPDPHCFYNEANTC